MTAFQQFTINGKEVSPRIIGRRNNQETYVFLTKPRKFWGGHTVYGVSYNLNDQKVVGACKFNDPLTKLTRYGDSSTLFGEFLTYWGLENRSITGFSVSRGVWGPPRNYKFIEDDWNFNGRTTSEELDDLEKILERLSSSHIDFAYKSATYDESQLNYQFVGEDPKIIIQRNLEDLSSMRTGRGAKAVHHHATHPKVVDTATMHHPLPVSIQRKYSYNDSTGIWMRYEFQGGKVREGWAPNIFPLAQPRIDGACFVMDETGSRFLDARGNVIGEPVGFPDGLRRMEGRVKDASGNEQEFTYVHYGKTLLDYRGERVGSVDEKGFTTTQKQ